jgi:hypothetical protein
MVRIRGSASNGVKAQKIFFGNEGEQVRKAVGNLEGELEKFVQEVRNRKGGEGGDIILKLTRYEFFISRLKRILKRLKWELRGSSRGSRENALEGCRGKNALKLAAWRYFKRMFSLFFPSSSISSLTSDPPHFRFQTSNLPLTPSTNLTNLATPLNTLPPLLRYGEVYTVWE